MACGPRWSSWAGLATITVVLSACRAFATAQQVPWLTECFFALLHGAAAGVREGRFTPAVAAEELTTTVLALVRSR
ncbi:hypothetical protein [Microbacterium sp.]|uniref:hypothetical protein n=1 Tax=Microbacterium sp. TaxID=51671 RepID=UPI0039E4339A